MTEVNRGSNTLDCFPKMFSPKCSFPKEEECIVMADVNHVSSTVNLWTVFSKFSNTDIALYKQKIGYIGTNKKELALM